MENLKEITAKLNQILTGYYHYYGITDNTKVTPPGSDPNVVNLPST